MISIVVPTRKRPRNIKRLVESIKKQSYDLSNIQVIFRVDDDDATATEIGIIAKNYLKDVYIIKDKPKENLSDLWNECYSSATYPLIMMCADDVIFRTKHWDRKVLKRLPNPKNTLYLAWGNDLNQKGIMPTLPILSKAWVENVGYFVPEGYISDFCDIHIFDIAKRLEKRGYNAMIYMKDIIFEHMHPTVGKAKWDEIYNKRRSRRGEAGQVYGNYSKERENTANKLFKLIKSGNIKCSKK